MKQYRVGREIRANQVRLVHNNEQIIMSLSDALYKAASLGLDLVEVAGNSNPPVCKIMDFKKIRFDESKKQRELLKKQKSSNKIKEIRMQPVISAHDLDFKVRNMRSFLEDNKRVKVIVRFRGRQFAHVDLGRKLLESIIEKLSDIGAIDGSINMEGRMMAMLLVKKSAPGKTKEA